ncbi:MAG: bifunctional glutamate N-acetyltransferase/amino-acid acetyltransferase ArgJ [Firmicutes bacterium]|nr:bifunctional glutamate N-acetyltransferase/amino-acid acetyltransferase ArgJ [Bacillota bacterium]
MAAPSKRVSAPPYVEIPGGVTAPLGFQAAGLHIGIKRRRKDLALIVSERRAAAAATFTTNRVQAAPVRVTREHVQGGVLRAIVCNSGIANACNGPQGMADARRMAQMTGEALGVPPGEVAVASTGVIGVPLPMDKIESGIRQAARLLSPEGGQDAAEAIMTTDTVPKEIALELPLKGRTVRIGGIAKGSGMIHPNMATMLAFLTTDAAVEPEALRVALRRSVERTYNRISVDGDTSTNDMVILMANGAAGHPPIRPGDPELEELQAALDYVNTRLAQAIVRDGEGATKLVEIRVVGARTEEDAVRVARTISTSNLVKTAIYGEDANWGRILCAAGYAGVDFDPDRVDVFIGELLVARDGAAVAFDEQKAREILHDSDVVLTVDLKAGPASATVWTCDLTYEYVKINASYRT